MATQEEITESIEKLAEICKEVVEYTASERMSFKMIRDDVTHNRSILTKVQQEISELEKRKEDLILELEEMKSLAKKEADDIIKIARENLAFASADREKAKKEMENSEQIKYLTEKELERITS